MDNLFDAIPGYRAAVEQESAIRDFAFLDEPDEIAGATVKPLTMRLMLLLTCADSPFVCGGEAQPKHVIMFLWIVSPQYVSRDKAALEAFSKSFKGRTDFAELCVAIREYVQRAFQDSPGSAGYKAIPFWSWAAGLVDRLATEYHWRERDIMDMPLARVFQYLKVIQKRQDPRAVLFNPSDAVRSRWMREQSAAN